MQIEDKDSEGLYDENLEICKVVLKSFIKGMKF